MILPTFSFDFTIKFSPSSDFGIFRFSKIRPQIGGLQNGGWSVHEWFRTLEDYYILIRFNSQCFNDNECRLWVIFRFSPSMTKTFLTYTPICGVSPPLKFSRPNFIILLYSIIFIIIIFANKDSSYYNINIMTIIYI